MTQHQQMRLMLVKLIVSYVNRCVARPKFVKIMMATYDLWPIFHNPQNSIFWKHGWKCLFAWIVFVEFLISSIPIKQS